MEQWIQTYSKVLSSGLVSVLFQYADHILCVYVRENR